MAAAGILALGGLGLQTFSQIQQGRAAQAQAESQQAILEFNAREKEKEALAEQDAARERAEKFSREARAFSGTQRVALARGGVLASEGTPALLLEDTAQELEQERLQILKQGFLRSEFRISEARGLRFSAASAGARGEAAITGSRFAAAGTLLTGLGQIGTQRSRFS